MGFRSRRLLNQSTHSRVASPTASNERHGPAPVNDLGFVKTIDGLGQSIVIRVWTSRLDGGERFRQQADIIRLLLLTGCRRNEILALRWSAVEDGKLVLGDSKTGPRQVPLNTQARGILGRQQRGGSPFVFPSPNDSSHPRGPELRVWYRVRRGPWRSQSGLQTIWCTPFRSDQLAVLTVEE